MQHPTAVANGGVSIPVSETMAGPSSGFSADVRIRAIEAIVEDAVASWHVSPQIMQCRRWHRVIYTEPLLLTPLDDATSEPIEAPMWVVGRDISLGGLSLTHTKPLPYRNVAVTFPHEGDDPLHVLVRLIWCRFTQKHTYDSGGRFVRFVELDDTLHEYLSEMKPALNRPDCRPIPAAPIFPAAE